MDIHRGYRCSVCGTEYGSHEMVYTCLRDGGNLDLVLDYHAIAAVGARERIAASTERSIWRYLPLLPVDDPGHLRTPLRAVGWTPLFRPERLGRELGLNRLWVKDDGRNPTASLKDRASAVVVARAWKLGAAVTVTASTGNAGAALAGMAAATGASALILAPRSAPRAKVSQLLLFGARVVLVDGSYDEAFDLSVEAAQAFGWYCRNTGYNPFTAEGKKTAAFEICEQLAAQEPERAATEWAAPDAVFVSVGDGNIISGLHRGFQDLLALGWIDAVPRLYGVQAEGSAAIYNAFVGGTETISAVHANTLADSISVNLPRDGLRALRAVRGTGGAYLTVSDEAILGAMRELAAEAGVFAEPAGAAPYAGLKLATEKQMVGAEESVVVLVTGSGLKDVESAMRAAGEPLVIEPTLPALEKALS